VDGTSFKDKNFGQDEILEVKKYFWNKSFDYPTRALISFKGTDFTNMSQSIVDSKITNPKFYLRLYEAEGNQETSLDYKLSAFPVSQSWDEGVGKFENNPLTTNGASWKNRNYYLNSTETTWSNASGNQIDVAINTGSWNASQSFSSESPDVEMNVTDIVNYWLLSGSNDGFLLRFSGSQETNNITLAQLNFFSSKTNTIFAPRLEVRWDDHKYESSSLWNPDSNSGSLTALTMSGVADNFLYMKGLRDSYRETERVKFRVGCRKRYIQKTFSTSVQTITGSFIPRGSGSYSILDVATGESIVPFSAYTSMSCDPTSNYFIQWLNGFYPNRVYKIIYRIKYNDGQEQIYDDGFEFKVKS
jgi:hypothetical protein